MAAISDGARPSAHESKGITMRHKDKGRAARQAHRAKQGRRREIVSYDGGRIVGRMPLDADCFVIPAPQLAAFVDGMRRMADELDARYELHLFRNNPLYRREG
ncbi:MAG: hypothetical protein ACREEK_00925 [Bradyrhizobium sp.]